MDSRLEDKILTAFEIYPNAKCIVRYSSGEWMLNSATANVHSLADGTWWESNSYDGVMAKVIGNLFNQMTLT